MYTRKNTRVMTRDGRTVHPLSYCNYIIHLFISTAKFNLQLVYVSVHPQIGFSGGMCYGTRSMKFCQTVKFANVKTAPPFHSPDLWGILQISVVLVITLGFKYCVMQNWHQF